MKRVYSMLIIAGLFVSACASKGVVKETEQPLAQKQISAPEQMQTHDKEAGKKVSHETTASKELDSMRLLKELQAKMMDIHFNYDNYVIRSEEKPLLKQVADTLRQNASLKLTIEGNCDERGTTEYNLALGDRRATAAREYLSSLGVHSGRMAIISYGKEKPLCTASNEACWAKNRRDHFVLDEGKR